MSQILVPISDQAVGGWTTTPLWSKVDDDSTVNPTGDGTTIASGDNTSPDNADFQLSSGSDPGVTTGHILRARWNKSASAGHSINAVLELWQGVPGTGTLIATLSVLAILETEVESTYTLTGTEAGNITNYADLYLRLSRQGQTGGAPSGRRSLVDDLVELELPDAATQVAVTQVSETDVAQPLTSKLTRLVIQVSETDTSQPITVAVPTVVAVGQTLETGLSQPLASSKSKAITQVSETDLSQPLTSSKSVSVSQAVETDIAQPVTSDTGPIVVPVGQALETDLSQSIDIDPYRRLISQVTEADLAQPVTVNPYRRLISQVTEVELAQPITRSGFFFVNSSSATTGGVLSTTLDIPKPAGVQEGDLIIVHVASGDSSQPTVTPPSGFTQVIDNSIDTTHLHEVFQKRATDSEPANYTFTWSLQKHPAGGLSVWRGDWGIGDVQEANDASGTSSDVVAPSTTAIVDKAFLLFLGTINATGTGFTHPAGMIELWDRLNSNRAINGAYEYRASAGATGSRTSSYDVTGPSGGVNLIITPAGVQGVLPAAEIDEALPLTLPQVIQVGQALETDLAQNITLGGVVVIPTRVASGYDDGSTISSLNVSITITDDSDRFLLALIAHANSGSVQTANSVVFDPGGGNEASFSFIDRSANTAGGRPTAEAWSLELANSVPNGTYTVTITMSDTVQRLGALVEQYQDTDLGNPIGATVEKAVANSNTMSDMLTTPQDGVRVIFAGVHQSGESFTPNSGTEVFDEVVVSGVTLWVADEEEQSGSTDVTISGSCTTANNWASLMLALQGVSASGISATVIQATEIDFSQPIDVNPYRRLISQASETEVSQALTSRKTLIAVQVAETDLALALNSSKIKVLGLTTETEVAQPITVTGETVVPVGQVTETDLAQPIDIDPYRRLISQAVEVDTARPVSVLGEIIVPVEQVIEIDLAQPVSIDPYRRLISLVSETDTSGQITSHKTVSTSQALESDTSQPITSGKSKVVSLSSEVEVAQSVSPAKVVLVGLVTETETSQAISSSKVKSISIASETDTARAINPAGEIFGTVNLVLETDLAQPVSWAPKNRLASQVAEVEVSQPVSSSKVKGTGQALESDISQVLTSHKTKAVSSALESDLAQAVTAEKAVTVAQAAETEVAQPLTSSKSVLVGLAEETNISLPVSQVGEIKVLIEQALETDLAQAVSWAPKHRLVALITETDLAQGTQSLRTIPVGSVSESDIAQPVSVVKTVNVVQITETEVAQPITLVGQLIIPVFQVVEVEVSQSVQPRKTQAIGFTTETNTAGPLTLDRAYIASIAQEVDLAQIITWAPKHRLVTLVTEVDFARNIQGSTGTLITDGKFEFSTRSTTSEWAVRSVEFEWDGD